LLSLTADFVGANAPTVYKKAAAVPIKLATCELYSSISAAEISWGKHPAHYGRTNNKFFHVFHGDMPCRETAQSNGFKSWCRRYQPSH